MIIKRTAQVLAFVGCLVLAKAALADDETSLDRYIAAPDPSYSFHLVATRDGSGFKTHVLEMTSQTWMSAKEVDRPVWKHWLVIVVPDHVKTSTALLFINGGSN